MKSLTDLGVVSAAYDLEHRLGEGQLETPVHLANGSILFVWRGRADHVELLTWMPSFPPVPPFQRLGGSDVWVLSLPLPREAMIEYRIGIHRHERRADVLDPLNPHTTTNPFGINSMALGIDRRRPEWTLPRDSVSAGEITEVRVQSRTWGERRHHQLYLPASQNSPLPLLVVHDGHDFLDHSSLATVLANLIADESIPPVAALLHRPTRRLTEYAHDERHVAHVLDEAIPHLGRRMDLDGRTVVLGSSLGAVAALSLAWHRPEEVTAIALLSGSFAHSLSDDRPAAIFGPVVELAATVDRDRRLAGMRAYASCGRYEGLIDLNRSLVPRLRAVGMDIAYDETWEGHQWASWRDRLRPALEHALG